MDKYWIHDDALFYGIINVSVASMRAFSIFQSEQVNQTLLGTIVPVLDKRDDFLSIRNWDGYRGWISKHTLHQVDENIADEWYHHNYIIVHENYAVVRSQKNFDSEVLTDLVPCIRLKKIGSDENFIQVELPDRRTGFVKKEAVRSQEEQEKIKIGKKQLIEQARKFSGIPYLWGGNSTKGFDCSGFVQTVFRLLNMDLPRDSGQQAKIGHTIPIVDGIEHLQTGDLLFFGKSDQRINHVAIYIGDGLYIHSRGKVGINSLNSGHPLYEEYLKSLFVKVQRVL
ncbi:MAG: hypothetical protein EH225_01565 [Calditrichaeota bacterium]|nr:C40 family peptidase [Calditrichota bacterium]RQW07574.1 MAG: hypothetical protein EH225_01565 [Calditrichota bacterium]